MAAEERSMKLSSKFLTIHFDALNDKIRGNRLKQKSTSAKGRTSKVTITTINDTECHRPESSNVVICDNRDHEPQETEINSNSPVFLCPDIFPVVPIHFNNYTELQPRSVSSCLLSRSSDCELVLSSDTEDLRRNVENSEVLSIVGTEHLLEEKLFYVNVFNDKEEIPQSDCFLTQKFQTDQVDLNKENGIQNLTVPPIEKIANSGFALSTEAQVSNDSTYPSKPVSILRNRTSTLRQASKSDLVPMTSWYPLSSINSQIFMVTKIRDREGNVIGEMVHRTNQGKAPASLSCKKKLTFADGGHQEADDKKQLKIKQKRIRRRLNPFRYQSRDMEALNNKYDNDEHNDNSRVANKEMDKNKESTNNNENFTSSDGRRENVKLGADDNVGNVTYLSVPMSPSNRRPSTASVVLEKLHVVRNEGGGLSISGLAFSANCHLTLIICGIFCLMAGIVLTYVAYINVKPPHSQSKSHNVNGDQRNEETPLESQNAATNTVSRNLTDTLNTFNAKKTRPSHPHHNLHIVGPACIVVGILMVLTGLVLFILGKKVNQDEKERHELEAEARLNDLQQSFSVDPGSPLRTSVPGHSLDQSYPIMSLRRSSWWMEPQAVSAIPKSSLDDIISYPAVTSQPPDTIDEEKHRPSSATSVLSSTRSNGSRTSSGSSKHQYGGSGWNAQERADVASFPNEENEYEPPRKAMRVISVHDQSKTITDKRTGSSGSWKTHSKNTQESCDLLNLEDEILDSEAATEKMPDFREKSHNSDEMASNFSIKGRKINLNAIYSRPTEYETLQEELAEETVDDDDEDRCSEEIIPSRKCSRESSRRSSISTVATVLSNNNHRSASASSAETYENAEPNLPFQVPTIHVTEENGTNLSRDNSAKS